MTCLLSFPHTQPHKQPRHQVDIPAIHTFTATCLSSRSACSTLLTNKHSTSRPVASALQYPPYPPSTSLAWAVISTSRQHSYNNQHLATSLSTSHRYPNSNGPRASFRLDELISECTCINLTCGNERIDINIKDPGKSEETCPRGTCREL